MGRSVIVRIVSHPTTWGSLTATAFLPKVGHPWDSVSLLGYVLLWQNRENVQKGALPQATPAPRVTDNHDNHAGTNAEARPKRPAGTND